MLRGACAGLQKKNLTAAVTAVTAVRCLCALNEFAYEPVSGGVKKEPNHCVRTAAAVVAVRVLLALLSRAGFRVAYY